MGKLDRNINRAVPHPKCPTLAWIIAKRVTNKNRDLDCTIMITGKKGSGKSTFSMNLAYEISKCIAIIHNREELKELSYDDRKVRIDQLAQHYFNMNHVRSVDKDGTMEMFSSSILKTDNAILICDDVSIAANSRNSMTTQNKSLTDIMTVSRVYRNVLIMNTVYSTMVDKNARNFSDIVIELLYVDEKKKRSVAKAYIYTVNQTTGNEYRKFFTWKGQRIKYWFSPLPPPYFNMEYKKLRKSKTNDLVDNKGEIFRDGKLKGHKRENKFNEALNTYKTKIEGLMDEAKATGKKMSIRSLTTIDPELTYDMANKIVAHINKERRVK
jgi:nucleoside-triphosphatase THEP1